MPGTSPGMTTCIAKRFSQFNQRDLHCPALAQKIFRFFCRANQFYQLAPSFPGKRGGSRVVTNAGWDAVDAAASARKVIAGRARLVSDRPARRTNGAGCVRQNRVVPTPVAGAKLPVADTIQPDAISHQAGSDGDKTNSSPGRARHKPSSHRAGNAGLPPLNLYARVRISLCIWHTRPRVQRAPGIPCSLFSMREKRSAKTRALSTARRRRHIRSPKNRTSP
jgi:hypothetical protein